MQNIKIVFNPISQQSPVELCSYKNRERNLIENSMILVLKNYSVDIKGYGHQFSTVLVVEIFANNIALSGSNASLARK